MRRWVGRGGGRISLLPLLSFSFFFLSFLLGSGGGSLIDSITRTFLPYLSKVLTHFDSYLKYVYTLRVSEWMLDLDPAWNLMFDILFPDLYLFFFIWFHIANRGKKKEFDTTLMKFDSDSRLSLGCWEVFFLSFDLRSEIWNRRAAHFLFLFFKEDAEHELSSLLDAGNIKST